MPTYKKQHSKSINISKAVSSSTIKDALGNMSNAKLSGYLKRKHEKKAKEKISSERFSEYSEKSLSRNHLRDAQDPKPLKERISDGFHKAVNYLKHHKLPKDKRAARQIKPKYLLLILAIACIALIIASGMSEAVRKPFKDIASVFVVPAQKGVNSIGLWLSDMIDTRHTMEELQAENKALKEQIDEMTVSLNSIIQDKEQVSRLEGLLSLKDTYSDYDMIGAHVIAKDSTKWFSTFTIDVGTNDGVKKDMNVIASGGLVGIIIDAGENFSTVRAIIDDESSVSAQFQNSSDLCMINGSLALMEKNLLEFTNVDADVFISQNTAVVTSHVSSKYLPGLLIGYVSDYFLDANDLTQSGHIKPVVDFSSLEEILVITTLKETVD